jgi:hypothetical protein
MKKALSIFALIWMFASMCPAEEALVFKQVSQALGTLIPAKPLDYRIMILYIPTDSSIDRMGTGSFRAWAPYQASITADAWGRPLKELLAIIGKMQAKGGTTVEGDYRWGIEIVGVWDQRPLTLYWDEKRCLVEINGVRCETDNQLNDWIKRYAEPVIAAMRHGAEILP